MNRSWSYPRTLMVAPAAVFPDTAARWIAHRLREAVRVRNHVFVALAGGGTPRPVYERLAVCDVPWPRVHILFSDERCVPPVDARSNYRMVEEALLSRLPAAPGAVHRMRGEAAHGSKAARAYEALLPDALDLVILGMGEDAHTASLFPGSAALAERMRRVLAVPGPATGPDRITLTPLALEGARERVVLVTGAAKAPVVREVLDGAQDPLRRPVQLARNDHWILDTGAARELRDTG